MLKQRKGKKGAEGEMKEWHAQWLCLGFATRRREEEGLEPLFMFRCWVDPTITGPFRSSMIGPESRLVGLTGTPRRLECRSNWQRKESLTWNSRYQNFRCSVHDKFFELNIYQKDPVNAHHWRHNLARPGSEIDL